MVARKGRATVTVHSLTVDERYCGWEKSISHDLNTTAETTVGWYLQEN